MEYRLYGKPNCNLFSLIGDGEVDQSKSLGLVLSQSERALQALIQLINGSGEKRLSKYKRSQRVIVDCEMRQKLADNKSYRADVVIRFFNEYGSPEQAIVIETKRKGAKINDENATEQIKNYWQTFDELKVFKEKNSVVLVTLTDVKTIFEKQDEVITLTWGELISAFENVEEPLVKEYINYLLTINENMKQYDKEILSIPAGNSYNDIINTHIYCCPAEGMFKSRGEAHPLYLTFRQKGSIMTELFKVKEILIMDRPVPDDIRPYLIEKYGKETAENIVNWPKNGKEHSYIFILDKDETIRLPKPVRFANGNAYTKELKLSQVFKDTKENEIII